VTAASRTTSATWWPRSSRHGSTLQRLSGPRALRRTGRAQCAVRGAGSRLGGHARAAWPGMLRRRVPRSLHHSCSLPGSHYRPFPPSASPEHLRGRSERALAARAAARRARGARAQAVQLMPPTVEGWVWFSDFHGFGVRDLSPSIGRAFLGARRAGQPWRRGPTAARPAPQPATGRCRTCWTLPCYHGALCPSSCPCQLQHALPHDVQGGSTRDFTLVRTVRPCTSPYASPVAPASLARAPAARRHQREALPRAPGPVPGRRRAAHLQRPVADAAAAGGPLHAPEDSLPAVRASAAPALVCFWDPLPAMRALCSSSSLVCIWDPLPAVRALRSSSSGLFGIWVLRTS